MGNTNSRHVILLLALMFEFCLNGVKGDESPLAEVTLPDRDNPFAVLSANPIAGPDPTVMEKPVVLQQQTYMALPDDLVLVTVNLKFLEAKNLVPVVQGMLNQYGKAAANEQSNSIMICDSKDNVAKIVREIRKADETPQQIRVDVVLLDVTLDNDEEIGVNWDLLSHNLYDVIYRQNLAADRILTTKNDTDEVGNGTVYNSTGPLGSDLSVISGSIRQVVHLLQNQKDVEILASPQALVVSGRTSTIKAAEEIPYQEQSDTSNGGSLTSTQFKDAGVTLEVNATLTDEDNIFLKIDIEQSVRTGESSGGVPVVDKRSEGTSLMLKDGQTVVMGGLQRKEKTLQAYKVPVLGDLPLVGFLFRNTQHVTKRAELVILLSLHIDQGGPIPTQVLERSDALRRAAPITGAETATDGETAATVSEATNEGR